MSTKNKRMLDTSKPLTVKKVIVGKHLAEDAFYKLLEEQPTLKERYGQYSREFQLDVMMFWFRDEDAVPENEEDDYDYGYGMYFDLVSFHKAYNRVVKAKEQENPDEPEWVHYKEVPDGKDEDGDKLYRKAPFATTENTEALIKYLGAELPRYNVMSKQVDLNIPAVEQYGVHVDTKEINNLTYLKSQAEMFKYPTKNIDADIYYIAASQFYHPVIDWIESKPWDGKKRIDVVTKCIKSETTLDEAIAMYFRKWCVGAVAALYKSDDPTEWRGTEGVLIFKGDQGIGKGRFFRGLTHGCPRRVYNDGLTLNTSDKDSLMEASRFWISEIGEIDGIFKKSESIALKNYITKPYDTIRVPYAKFHTEFPRRSVFVGTVNEQQFLQRESNRRFWVIDISEFDDRIEGANMQQFWAEIKHYYDQGENYWLHTSKEKRIHKTANEEFKAISPCIELCESRVVNPNNKDAKLANCVEQTYNATEILRHLHFYTNNTQHTKDVCTWLRENEFKEHSRRKFEVAIRNDYDEAFQIVPKKR